MCRCASPTTKAAVTFFGGPQAEIISFNLQRNTTLVAVRRPSPSSIRASSMDDCLLPTMELTCHFSHA